MRTNKKNLRFRLFVIFLITTTISNVLSAQRSNINLNMGWKFGSTTDANAISTSFNDASWTTITLPYTWNGYDGQDGGNNLVRAARWYRKSILAETAWQGKKVFLKIGAANIKTDVYINGVSVGSHIGGFAAFDFDITNKLTYGSNNLISVKVDNSTGIDAAPLSGDFSFFGGISRDVELIITEPIFISPLDYASSGVYITPHNITDQKADVNIKVLVGNHYAENKNIEVISSIKDKNGNIVNTTSSVVTVNTNSIQTVELNSSITNPVRWDAKRNPYVYKVDLSLKVNNVVVDQITQPLGVRTYNVDANTGFKLNGSSYNLHGVCFHEDRPNIGRCLSNQQRKEDLDILQDLGCTYIRLVHYQHGQYTYDYCDSVGVVLSTEIPLVNSISSSTAFTDNAKSQLNELIKQNYNHPSVLFWGMYNEVDFQAGPSPTTLVNQLNILTHQLDSTRLTTGAAQKDETDIHFLLDVCGWNKYMGWYDGSFASFATWADWLHSAHPTTKIAMSEYGAGASVKHHQDFSIQPVPGGLFHPEEYQSDYHEAYYQAMLQRPYIWSTAVWVAFDLASDYRAEGDAMGINDKGLVTRDRKVKKDAYYYYKANWVENPFVYISSRRFTNRISAYTKVKIYSNCDSVTLKINNKSYTSKTSTNHIFTWNDIVLSKGDNVVTSKGYKNNQVYNDTCIWKFTKTTNDTLRTGNVKINFQTNTSVTPKGFLADNGASYADRGNGYTYGWNTTNTANARQRTSTNDTIFNTFNHIIKDGTSYSWEIAVPNGKYQISLACGDPDYTDSYHKVLAEGQLILEGYNASTAMKVTTDTVVVLDGKLTLTPATGAYNAKINEIQFTLLESMSPTGFGIQNGSFELPATDAKYRADGAGGASVFNGNVPGWWADLKATDCGRQSSSKPAYEGKYTSYAYNNDGGSIWALAGTIPANKRKLDLTYYAWESFPKGQTGVSAVAKFAVYNGDDPSKYTLLNTQSKSFSASFADANGWQKFNFIYTLPDSVVGKNLLIGYDVATQGTADSWYSFDNFILVTGDITALSDLSDNRITVICTNKNAGICVSNANPNATYTLYNIIGRTVSSGKLISDNRINVSGLTDGVYILNIYSPEGLKSFKLNIK